MPYVRNSLPMSDSSRHPIGSAAADHPDRADRPVCVVSAHTLLGDLIESTLRARDLPVERALGVDLENVGAASHGCDLVLVCTWGLPRRGLQITRYLTSLDPNSRVLLIDDSVNDDEAQIFLRAGALAVVGLGVALVDVLGAIDAARRGDSTLRTRVKASESQRDDDTSPFARATPLTTRETEVLQLVVDGRTVSETARVLFLSSKTVRHHLSAIYAKLGVTNRTDAVIRGLRRGLVDLGHE